MGACASQKVNRPLLRPPVVDTDITDENVLRIKKQFDDLTQLLESMSQEFKIITDGIIKQQQQQYSQIQN